MYIFILYMYSQTHIYVFVFVDKWFHEKLGAQQILEVYPEFSNISPISGLQEKMKQFTGMFLAYVRLAGLNVFFDTRVGKDL